MKKILASMLCVVMLIAMPGTVCAEPDEHGNEIALSPETILSGDKANDSRPGDENGEPPPEDADISAAQAPCDCDAVPVILLSGGHGALTENYGQPDERWYYGIDMLGNLVRDAGPLLLRDVLPSLLTFNPSKFVDAAIRAFWAWVGPLEMLPDGASVKQLERVDKDYEWRMGLDHWLNYHWGTFYRFPFDWRQSPFQIADELDAYVQMIKAHTGHAHVHISSISGSSSPLLAYTEKYVNGVEDPDALSIVYSQPTAFGMELVGNFLNADYSMNPRNAGSLDYFYTLDLPPLVNTAMMSVMRGIYLLGVMNLLAIGTSFYPQAAFDRIYEEVTRRTYAAWPGMWSWCPPEDYASARARLIDGHPEYEQLGFLEKIDRYHALQLRAGDVLREAGRKIKVAAVAGYNMALLPLGKEKNDSSDGMVAVRKASLGAVAAPYRGRLPSGYAQAVDDGHNHLSLDRKIDASACALPEDTWFVRDMVHRGFYFLDGWYEWWRTAPKGEDTVFGNPEYPQFMRIENKTQTDENMVLLPVTEEPDTFLETLRGFWYRVLSASFDLLYSWAGVLRWPLGWFWRIWF